jgi:hypothetical protein
MSFSREVTIEKSNRSFGGIYYLKDGFGLLKEGKHDNYFISLIFLDLHRRIFRKIHTIEHISLLPKIVINQSDQTEFILTRDIANERSWQICKIVKNTIIVEDVIEIERNLDSFYGDNVYSLKKEYRSQSRVSFLFKCLVNSLNVLDT